jgi:hypothetical protein
LVGAAKKAKPFRPTSPIGRLRATSRECSGGRGKVIPGD